MDSFPRAFLRFHCEARLRTWKWKAQHSRSVSWKEVQVEQL